MPDLILYGPALSTCVRTARMACAEKGVPHTLEEVDFRAEGYRKLHPFNRVPSMRHGDFVLFETGAIGRYIDRAFEGPALQPADIRGLARMDQWLSAVSDYVYEVMIRGLCWERLMVPMRGGTPDEAKIAAAAPKVAYQLSVLEGVLAENAFLAGDALSLADLLLFPVLVYVKLTPEGGAAMKHAPSVAAWFDRIAARPSAAATDPARG
ncbi:MAG: glutathione S-transferase family protein [Rhodospirillaceae bacterium]|nr:glutathione S-transferase family protein [Rhodospirillaceae bacterium]